VHVIVKGDGLVDLVVEQIQRLLASSLTTLVLFDQQLAKGFDLGARHDTARRVLRAVQHEQPRLAQVRAQ
jgi:hypothetical protein